MSENHCNDEGCGCGHDHESAEDIAFHADDKIDALIGLLIKKKIITEAEFVEEFNSMFEADDSEEETE